MAQPPVIASLAHLSWEGEYHSHLGHFHGLWAAVDLTTDFAIGKFLKVTNEEAHLITSGMMFGRKARLLGGLIKRSDHPKKAQLQGAFNAIRATPRDAITHGYQAYSRSQVAFLERPAGGDMRARQHTFSHEEFAQLVSKLVSDSHAFYEALEANSADVSAFAEAALSLDRKSSKAAGET